MKIQCENCGKKYRIDEGKIKGPSVKLRCRACEHIMVVEKPAPEGEDLVDFGSIAASPEIDRPHTDTTTSSAGRSAETAHAGLGAEAEPAPKKIRFGLFFKIVILMLVASLLPLGVYWSITFNKTSDLCLENAETFMAQTGLGVKNQVDEWIDKNVRVLNTAARLPEMIAMDRKRQEPVLKAIQKSYPWMYLVFTVDPNGFNTARSDGKPLKDYSDRQYYKGVIQGKKVSWQTLIGKTSKKPALVMAVPILKAGRIVGVMAMASTIDDISKGVARWRHGRTGFAFLVDETGKVVSHQRKRYVIQQKNLNTHPLIQAYRKDKRAKTLQFKDERGREVLGHVLGNQYDWVLVVRQEAQEIHEPLKGVQYFFYILLIATILVVSIIAWFFARTVVKPIMTLTDVAERMSLGELDISVDVKSKDEIGLLAQAVERMRISLNLAMSRLRRKR
ncbi:MAG: cache domain-containing protein [Thermodesulfobacteriota bacterium]|nr:cache domain-containing protein [Thermodesulfobacteriota bacterium]